MRLVKLVVLMLFVAHLLGSFWFYLALNAPDDDAPTWATEYDGGAVVAEDATLSKKYLYAIYWSLMTLTTVGYGDVVPQNDQERAYVAFCLLVGSFVFAYIVGEIGGLINA